MIFHLYIILSIFPGARDWFPAIEILFDGLSVISEAATLFFFFFTKISSRHLQRQKAGFEKPVRGIKTRAQN